MKKLLLIASLVSAGNAFGMPSQGLLGFCSSLFAKSPEQELKDTRERLDKKRSLDYKNLLFFAVGQLALLKKGDNEVSAEALESVAPLLNNRAEKIEDVYKEDCMNLACQKRDLAYKNLFYSLGEHAYLFKKGNNELDVKALESAAPLLTLASKKIENAYRIECDEIQSGYEYALNIKEEFDACEHVSFM
jgi:hypothetical protein